jgi:hypothetical protein
MQTGQRSYGRWKILGLICLMYLITYLDRVIMANTAPEIRAEFGFDQKTMGWILSSFVGSSAPLSGPMRCSRFPAAGSASASARGRCLPVSSHTGRS